MFISSTFRDMQQERDELVKRVFPLARHRCESRGVAWSEIDLRWGVTDEQKAEGAVLPICLAEIERSRPYFIALLGERYGWVPDELPAELATRLGWLDESAGRSVTELEILHGVLNDPDAAGHAFFYLRDPAWVDAQPADERAALVDTDPEARAKLADLKRRVRTSGHPVRNYADPVALGELVLADLVALIDDLYPETTVPDPVEREAAEHAAYAANRFDGYVARPRLHAALDAHGGGGGLPLLVTSEPGLDASALVANWARAWRAGHPADLVVEHYVGATAASAEWTALVRRVVAEVGKGHGLADVDAASIPSDPVGCRAVLARALDRAGSTGRRTVLVIDGVDALADVDGAPDLVWLPPAPPAAVRVVLTSTGGRPLDTARQRSWSVLDVPPLDADERRQLVVEYLARSAKALDDAHVDRLATATHTGNALFLRVVLDELRQHGDHFTLGAVLDRLLAAATVDDLLELVLARYEQDYERDRPGLVSDAFSALWAARHGLSEAELLAVLGSGGEPIPHATWSPLYLAAEDGLVTRSGYLRFATDIHRQAVHDRYLSSDEARRAAHSRLAAYFAAQPLGPRVVDELPWQQLAAGDLDGLVSTLADLDFTDAAYRRAWPDLRRLWVHAEAAGHRMVDTYRAVVDDPGVHGELAWAAARLLTDAGYPGEALRLHRFVVADARTGGPATEARLRAALVNLGAALLAQGELAAADEAMGEAVALCRAASDAAALRAALGNLAVIRRERGDLDAAGSLLAEEEGLCRESGDLVGLQASLAQQVQLHRQRGDPDGALAKADEQANVCRELGDRMGIARAAATRAALLADRGDATAAIPAWEEHGRMCRELGDLRGLAESLFSQATLRHQLGELDAATVLADEAEAIARRVADLPLVARVLTARAGIAGDRGAWPEAERLAREGELSARSAGAPALVAVALGLLGTARREQGDIGGAEEAHRAERDAATTVGDPGAVALADSNLAAVDITAGRLQDAVAKYGEAEPVLRRLGHVTVLVHLLLNRGQVHRALGTVDPALADFRDAATIAADLGWAVQRHHALTMAVELLYAAGRMAESEPVWGEMADACHALGDDAGLQRALGERALVLLGRGDLHEAAALLDEQEAVCRRAGDQVGLAACVGNRAVLLRQRGDLVGSLACIEEQLAVSKASGNAQGVLFATANRGEVLGELGRKAEGLAALDEARGIALRAGLTPMVAQLDQMIAHLRAS